MSAIDYTLSHPCAICKLPVPLTDAVVDHEGKAVHSECYIAFLLQLHKEYLKTYGRVPDDWIDRHYTAKRRLVA